MKPKPIRDFEKAVEAACAARPPVVEHRTHGIAVYFRQQEGHLPPERLREEFLKLGRSDPLWSALTQLVQQRLANAIVAASQNEPNAPGRLEELLDLQRELAGLRDAPENVRRPKVTPN